MGSGKGFEFYRNNYTHDELWQMLSMGDSWSVEQAAGVWRTAKQDISSAKDNLDTAMTEIVGYWEGPASEEYQRRMEILREYGDEAATSMERAETRILPTLAEFLSEAQQQAAGQDLYPSSTLEDYPDWLEATKPEDLHYGQSKEETQRTQLQQEHQEYLTNRHDEMARIVADLGDKYQDVGEEWREPPPPPPSDLPGNETYQPPTGGVFGSDGLNPAGGPNAGLGNAPGGDQNSNLAGADGIVGTDDDLEPVDGWTPGSYADVDSTGGVSGGGLAAGTYSTGFSGGAAAPVGGGGGVTGGGGGLFGPAAGTTGGTTGRGGTTTSPARSGASSNARGTGGRGGPNTTGGRPGSSTRGLNGRNNMGGRGTGGRGAYADDDEEEEYSRETWLKEDDVNWGSNRTPDEEVDD